MDLIAYENNDKAVIEQQKEFYDDTSLYISWVVYPLLK